MENCCLAGLWLSSSSLMKANRMPVPGTGSQDRLCHLTILTAPVLSYFFLYKGAEVPESRGTYTQDITLNKG